MMGNLEPKLSMDAAMKVKVGSRMNDLTVFFLIALGFQFRMNKMVYDKECMEPMNVIEHHLFLQKMFADIKALANVNNE